MCDLGIDMRAAHKFAASSAYDVSIPPSLQVVLPENGNFPPDMTHQ